MRIGVPKEIKNEENRVALIPRYTSILVEAGHEVLVESNAGLGSGLGDDEYVRTGARICNAENAWSADLVLKVKEPVESEYSYLRDQIVFTFFHLAGVPRSLTETLLERRTTAVAYETLEDKFGRLPILAPMSAVAGNMAALVGAYYLAGFNDGKGVQLGKVLGTRHGRVLIVGDGVVAFHAAQTAWGLGAQVSVAGMDEAKGELMQREISADLEFFASEPEAIARQVREADLVVGAVLRHGAKADYVVTEDMVKSMQPGSVIVDVSIDQGGCVETSRPTTHSEPVYEKHGVIHYCVTNMPGAYPRTSTLALTEATFPYVLRLANRGLAVFRDEPGLGKAVNTYQGYLTCKPVAETFGLMERYSAFAAL
ncbi:alanine dehydrogenase [Methylocaldum sp.]|uniref:alanine dehydrogenase n=1 Tax=Methylocaldum sp. TaxID=1969727 RepID=UPI002D64B890|nr:alanine dehydrogenase [Methylocaldum sp.]HYE36959.1 alanine dehydrogenase [Methylocaldum sp.]